MGEYPVKTPVSSGKNCYHSIGTLEGFEDEGKERELLEVRLKLR